MGHLRRRAHHLLEVHPEFARDRRAHGHIQSQIAFARVAARERRRRKWAVRALRSDPRQIKAWLALAISARLMSSGFVVGLVSGWARVFDEIADHVLRRRTHSQLTAVRGAGLDYAALTDALYVAYVFNVINRIADALDFGYRSDRDRLRGARILRRNGYRLPAWLLQ